MGAGVAPTIPGVSEKRLSVIEPTYSQSQGFEEVHRDREREKEV